MSLENTYQKLRKIENTPLWKFLLISSVLPAVVSMVLVYLLNPNPATVQLLSNPLGKFMIFMSLLCTYMILAAGGLAIGIMLTLSLIKLRDGFNSKGGKIIGPALATNIKFLYELAQGLFPHLIGFIKSYNDPKFEEQEVRHQRELEELKGELKIEIKKVSDKSEKDTEMFIRELRIKNLAIHKITNLKNESDRKVAKYEKNESVKKQQIGNRIDAQDINENTKVNDLDDKFE